jgi:ParB/RepB/Spo0J family partition protein
MSQSLQQLPASQIRPGSNDRHRFDLEQLTDLAWSIKTNGLAQPITVRPMPDGHYEIIAGERRYRAMTQILGYDTIPCLVDARDDASASAIMLAENCARVDLNPIEEAQAYQARIDQFGWTVERLADTAGVSKDIVKKRLGLLSLREEIQHLVKHEGLPLGHAEALCGLDRNRQLSALRILQQSPTPMPIAAFRDVCAELLAEQNQDNLFGLELAFVEQVQQGAGNRINTDQTVRSLPIRSDLPDVVHGREKGMTLAVAIETYIERLQAAGCAQEAATIGTLYAGLLKAHLLKPRTRLRAVP